MDREGLFTFKMQVKQKMLSTILDRSSQNNLILSSIVQELGLALNDHTNPYELSEKNWESFDKVTKQCTFKYNITKDFIDEMACDVVPIDYTNILVSIPFLYDRKTHIVPY